MLHLMFAVLVVIGPVSAPKGNCNCSGLMGYISVPIDGLIHKLVRYGAGPPRDEDPSIA